MFTRRRSGRHMVTFRIRYDLTVSELIDRVTHQISRYGTDLPTSRAAAFEMARRDLRETGTNFLPGDMEDEWDELRDDVANHLRLLWPDLVTEEGSSR